MCSPLCVQTRGPPGDYIESDLVVGRQRFRLLCFCIRCLRSRGSQETILRSDEAFERSPLLGISGVVLSCNKHGPCITAGLPWTEIQGGSANTDQSCLAGPLVMLRTAASWSALPISPRCFGAVRREIVHDPIDVLLNWTARIRLFLVGHGASSSAVSLIWCRASALTLRDHSRCPNSASARIRSALCLLAPRCRVEAVQCSPGLLALRDHNVAITPPQQFETAKRRRPRR